MRQRRGLRPALISAAAAAACLTLATPAWASETVPLHDGHKGSTAGDFKTQECDDKRFDSLPDGQDGWHFVLPEHAGDFVSLHLTFSGGTIDMVRADDAAHDEYAFYQAGKQWKQAYLFTPAGWTLLSGTATIEGTAREFNLSHTCPGTPSGSPSPSDSSSPSETPSESESATPSESATTPGGGDDGDNLPITGVAAGSIALVGVALVGGGAALMVMRRRRDNVTFIS